MSFSFSLPILFYKYKYLTEFLHSNHKQVMNCFKKFPWLLRRILKWLKNVASAWIALPVFKIKVFLERWNILLVAYPDKKKATIVILPKLVAIYIYPTICIFLAVIFVLKKHQTFEPLRFIHPLWIQIITGSRTFYIKHKILHYIEKFMKNLFFIKKSKIVSSID